MNTETDEKGLPTRMLDGIPNAPSTGYTLPKSHGSESHLFHSDTVEVGFKLKHLLFLEPIDTADDLHSSLQKHNLLSRPLFCSQQ